jgi:predicted permease
MVLGYFFKKKDLVSDTLSTVISRLEVFAFMPALCFNTFAGNFRVETLFEKSAFLSAGCIVLGTSFFPALLFSRLLSKKPETRGVYLYALTSPNFGYLGYPLILAVYGEETLLNYMIFAIPYNLFVYTAGQYILSKHKHFTFRNILNPTFISIILGIAAGLTGLRLPVFAENTLDMAAACIGPLAMIMTGFVLGRTPFFANFQNPKIYLASALRLLVFPLIFGSAMVLLHIAAEVILITVSFLCLPLGLNNVIFPEAYGGDSATGARTCFISQILGVLTIPAMFALIQLWVN